MSSASVIGHVRKFSFRMLRVMTLGFCWFCFQRSLRCYESKITIFQLEDIANSQGVHYNKEDVIQKIKNQDGKFAVQYNIIGADCYAVSNDRAIDGDGCEAQ